MLHAVAIGNGLSCVLKHACLVEGRVGVHGEQTLAEERNIGIGQLYLGYLTVDVTLERIAFCLGIM